MVSIKDIATLALIGGILFLAIRAGRDLFGALSGIQAPQIPNINLPAINIGGSTIETQFPEIQAPDLDILNQIPQDGLATLQNNEILNLLRGLTPLGTPENPADAPTAPTPTDVVLTDPSLDDERKRELFRELNPELFDPATNPNLDPNRFLPTFGRGFTGREEDRPVFQGPSINPSTGEQADFTLDPNRPLDLTDLINRTLLPSQQFELSRNLGDQSPAEVLERTVTPQTFTSLSSIIEQFRSDFGIDISASQAADIRAGLAGEDFGGFDFGTNTGSAESFRDANFGQGDQELQAAIEAAQAAANDVFQGTSNFANPDFPITLGEAFLGKQGTVVSPSIANLEGEDLQRFIDTFG